MKLKKQDYNDVTVVEMQGELDADAADLLTGTVKEIIGSAQAGIVLDMRGTDFIDSVGLEQLLWARDYCDQNNCQVKLAGLDDNGQKILELTRLDVEFDQYAELAEAVKSFA